MAKKKDFKPVTAEDRDKKMTVFAGLCKGCRICQQVCPQKAIKIDPDNRGVYNNKTVKIDPKLCGACMLCERACPDNAIKIEKKDKKKNKKDK